MSSIYVLEPPTKGKVILNTTYGPLDIELWPKEAPKAVRNFVQLCLEGYYDNTTFHRIIKGFLVQAGDPTASGTGGESIYGIPVLEAGDATASGTGGESIYGSPFADEFHSRLRFNHRGIVACANAGPPNSNGSQFFISLDKCDWLDRKNTIFGKVTGDSIYNLLAFGEVETDKDDHPLDPVPKIKSVEVLWNPFEDIVPRALSKPLTQNDLDIKEPKKKAVKKLNLLSFGEEAEEEEKELAAVKHKIKSSHDVLNDPRLLKEEDNPSEDKATRDVQLSVREALSSKKEVAHGDSKPESFSSDDGDDDGDEASFDARMRQQILKKRKELGDKPSKHIQNGRSSVKDHQMLMPRSNDESDEDEKPRVEKLSLKKKGIGSEARVERMANADVDLQLYGEAERGRIAQKQKKRRLQGREDDVLAKLDKFKKALSEKPATRKNESSGIEREDLSDLSDWTKVRLTFAVEPGKDRMSRTEDPNDYVVHDPLLEKGKEKFNRMQAKQKRREREWAGKSLT